MTKINNDLISEIKKINEITLFIGENNLSLSNYENLNDNDIIYNYDNLNNTITNINNKLDQLETYVNNVVKMEPNYTLRCLYFSLVSNLEQEDYIKCQEISNQIKTFNV